MKIIDLEESSDRPKLNWYPGHMAKASREIKAKIKLVDIIFEIRDARAPKTSGNPELDQILSQKSRLIILNKSNFVEASDLIRWEAWFKKQELNFIFVNVMDKIALKKVTKLAKKIIQQKNLKSNPHSSDQKKEKKKLKIMVIGLPNTGKSTVINQLAGRNATKVAPSPGQTQHQLWISIDNKENKDLELMDTPGVMPPHVSSETQGIWLSAIHAMPDVVIGEELTATYVVKYFLKNKSLYFKERFQLENFDGPVEAVMEKIAVLRGCIKEKGRPDLERVYKLILLEFRKGDLGKCCFEMPPLTK